MKLKRMLALAGVILLIGMYVVTLIAAITSSPQSPALFKASLVCTMVVPVVLYGYQLIYRTMGQKKEKKDENRD